MLDPRVTTLAELLCSHSTRLEQGDRVLVHAFDVPQEAVAEVVRVARSFGAQVVVRLESNRVRRSLLHGMTEENAALIAEVEKFEMERMTAYIALRGGDNAFELADVPAPTMAMWSRVYAQPVVFQTRVPKTKWVALRWPSASMAQQAGMPTEAFEDFYFRVCTLDYARMRKAAEPLAELMAKTDEVRIVGPGETDLRFSIRGIGAKACSGERNIPDGECFTAPVPDSVEGVIRFNTVSLYQGQEFSDIRYVVRGGRIVEAEAGAMTAKLNEILDTDEGARRFGEWSLGYNPHVLHPMRDTLFDEKIAGSFHLTPGNSYNPPGGNGNVSAIHWDTVMIQRPEYGGGEIWFDGVLVRKDGRFVLPELEGLNPEHLAAGA
ncbi:MAG: aminopeptidase [Fimbriimonadales bacterium]|nr:aminopeptidase [Fimbriimonadales bacterium]